MAGERCRLWLHIFNLNDCSCQSPIEAFGRRRRRENNIADGVVKAKYDVVINLEPVNSAAQPLNSTTVVDYVTNATRQAVDDGIVVNGNTADANITEITVVHGEHALVLLVIQGVQLQHDHGTDIYYIITS